MYVYLHSEPNLFTVGSYDPKGNWIPDCDFSTREEARQRVHYLNGGGDFEILEARIKTLEDAVKALTEK
jgi:hypothetical protein